MKQKLGIAFNVKELNARPHHLKNYYEIAKRADEVGLYYLACPNMVTRGLPGVETFAYISSLIARTRNVRIGTDVWQLPLYHPIIVASRAATLDVISKGRFIFGVGTGWRPDEHETLGVPWRERWERFDETIEIVKKLWTEPSVTYNGKFYKFKDAVCIKPFQEPHPPVWVGGNSDNSIKRAVKYGDAWAPLAWPFWGFKIAEGFSFEERVEKFKEYCKQFGRDPKTISFNVRFHTNINSSREKAIEDAMGHYVGTRKTRVGGGGPAEYQIKWGVWGPAEIVIEKIKEFYKLGADLAILWIMTTDLRSQWEKVEKEIIPSM